MKVIGWIFFLSALSVLTYGQPALDRQKGQIIFGDSAKVSGWIEGLSNARLDHLPFVTLYADSTARIGQRINAGRAVKIILDNGERYLGAVANELGHNTPDDQVPYMKQLPFYFMPLAIEGQFNVVRQHHGTHMDLNIILLRNGVPVAVFLEQQSMDGRSLLGEAQVLPCEYLETMLEQYPFLDSWRQTLKNKLFDYTLTCEQKVALFNIAVAQNKQEIIASGINRWRLSLTGGATFNYDQISVQMRHDYKGRAPVNGGFVFAEIGKKKVDKTEFTGGAGVGYKQHHFNGFYFNSLHFNLGGKLQWSYHRKFDVLWRMVYGSYVCYWSGVLARQLRDPVNGMLGPKRRHDAVILRGGILTRPSNWELGLSYTCESELETVSYRLTPHVIGIYAAKHFDFYLDSFGRRKKISK